MYCKQREDHHQQQQRVVQGSSFLIDDILSNGQRVAVETLATNGDVNTDYIDDTDEKLRDLEGKLRI